MFLDLTLKWYYLLHYQRRLKYILEYDYPYSPEEAMDLVKQELYWDGFVNDEEDLYTSEGYAKVTHVGPHEIDGYTYYILRVDFYTSGGALDSTVYRGVGVNFGNVYYIEQDEDGDYYVNWW